MWKDNLRPYRSCAFGVRCTLSGTERPDELKWNPRLSDMEDRGIAGLELIKDKVRRRHRPIALIIKIVCINERYEPRGE